MKIPGLDELKKASADLMDSAKSKGLGGMMDKLKAGIDSMGERMVKPGTTETSNVVKDEPVAPSAPVAEKAKPVAAAEDVQAILQEMRAALVELTQMQVSQDELIKKINNQFIDLTLKIEPDQTSQNKEGK
ncbi:MAG: hypothetical protein P4M12_01350 [Gammaproteobacteria bacterium]|nr:hypothetical protein [Gammaproteobacteria bacterium]